MVCSPSNRRPIFFCALSKSQANDVTKKNSLIRTIPFGFVFEQVVFVLMTLRFYLTKSMLLYCRKSEKEKKIQLENCPIS